MKHDLDLQKTAVEERTADTDTELALVRLESAVETARAAGRPVTAGTRFGKARELRARQRRLEVAVNASRNRVAYQTDDLGLDDLGGDDAEV